MGKCIYVRRGCPSVGDGCTSEYEAMCDFAIRRAELKHIPCPMIPGKFEIKNSDALKCEITLFRELTPIDVICGNTEECFLRRVPEIKPFVSGSLMYLKIDKLNHEELSVIRDSIIRVLRYSSRISESTPRTISAST